jgi:hypothetical protein
MIPFLQDCDAGSQHLRVLLAVLRWFHQQLPKPLAGVKFPLLSRT